MADNPYETAALDDLFGKIPFLNGVLGDITEQETVRVRKQIADKRKWVDGLQDRKWRNAYHKWLDHAERCCHEADRYREERPRRRAESERDEARYRKEKEAARELMKTNPPA